MSACNRRVGSAIRYSVKVIEQGAVVREVEVNATSAQAAAQHVVDRRLSRSKGPTGDRYQLRAVVYYEVSKSQMARMRFYSKE